MVRLFKVKDLTIRKRLLIAQSDVDRQTLKLQIAAAAVAFEHIKSKLAGLELSSFALKTAADIAGLFMSRAKPAISGGVISKVVAGVKFFNVVKNFFSGVKAHAPEHE